MADRSPVGLSHRTLSESGPYRELSLEGLQPETALGLYGFMVRLRRAEEALMAEYHPADEMRCPVHFCVGQEAAPAALAALLEPNDYLFSHHRSHGHFLAKGAPMSALFAELYGKVDGANGGLAGSQDISSHAHRVYAGAIVAGAVGISTGVGLGISLNAGDRSVAVAGFGEGATDEGIFWEAIAYAVANDLPVVFVCENNRYATYSDQLKRHRVDNVAEKVRAFGLESTAVFGNDVALVYRTIERAVDKARGGGGPSFVECYTYRRFSHVGPEGDDYVGYRPEAERQFWYENCPMDLFERALREAGWLSDADAAGIGSAADEEVGAAFSFAKDSAFPSAPDWDILNNNPDAGLAGQLLQDGTDHLPQKFDHHQTDAIPGPY